MDTNVQKYMAFIKTVEYGSFTKAAEILNYSQSAVSRMINAIYFCTLVSIFNSSVCAFL